MAPGREPIPGLLVHLKRLLIMIIKREVMGENRITDHDESFKDS
jgi:hypothetical protein